MNTGKKGGRWCAAAQCRANSKSFNNISFFSFPEDEERCKVWAVNCNRLDLLDRGSRHCHENCKLCAWHFEDKILMLCQHDFHFLSDSENAAREDSEVLHEPVVKKEIVEKEESNLMLTRESSSIQMRKKEIEPSNSLTYEPQPSTSTGLQHISEENVEEFSDDEGESYRSNVFM
ncbi:hypothetical protein NQ317_017437 [Molorchus minor]|uniref:THAP-type domain-containing protein n=1 Tax=Molorchus minor TaxID=1323400 RepID=A0ABQ9JA21_9CUCU|nr:hypothetical protein NQ317_017437 [Molorchus minor]